MAEIIGPRTMKKFSLEEKSELYDQLYAEGERILQEFNPCNIRKVDGHVVCNGRSYREGMDSRLCCGQCEYHTPSGCSVKNVNCKLFLCGTPTYDKSGKVTPVAQKMHLLQDLAREVGIPLIFFRDKGDVLAGKSWDRTEP